MVLVVALAGPGMAPLLPLVGPVLGDAMCRDEAARSLAEARDAAAARASANAAREELRLLALIPVTPEEEHAWIELERRRGSRS